MKVIICGAGQVGYNIAEYLAQEGNDVTVIDQSPELIQKINDNLDIQAVNGFASQPDVLEEAGATAADMLVAVTLSDEVNMVACQVAHTLFNVPTKAPDPQPSLYGPALVSAFCARPNADRSHHLARNGSRPGRRPAFGRTRRVRHDPAGRRTGQGGQGVLCSGRCPILNTPLRQLGGLFPT